MEQITDFLGVFKRMKWEKWNEREEMQKKENPEKMKKKTTT